VFILTDNKQTMLNNILLSDNKFSSELNLFPMFFDDYRMANVSIFLAVKNIIITFIKG
jgi:hypothetical protein